MHRLAALALLSVPFAACYLDDDDYASGPYPCISGRQASCSCPDGSQGIQVCQEDRSFSDCQCRPGGASGASGHSGSGPAGGMSGKSGQGGASAGGQAGKGGAGPSGAGQAGKGGTSTDPCTTLPAATPALLIVLDRSGTTKDNDRYKIASAAIQQFLASAPLTLPVGLLRFPEGNFDTSKQAGCTGFPVSPNCQEILADGGCQDVASPPGVPAAPLSTAKSSILALLNSTDPGGYSPTRWALKNAWSSLASVPADGGRHVVLISDGAPTVQGFLNGQELNVACATQAQILDEATSAAQGSPATLTHAIGMPVEDKKTALWLSNLAQAGGTAPPTCTDGTGETSCHYPGFTAAAIAGALTEIAAIGCRFALPAFSSAGFSLRLETTAGPILVPNDPQRQQGWALESPGVVRLYGSACQQLQQSPQSQAKACP